MFANVYLELCQLTPELNLQLTHDVRVLDPLDDLVEGFQLNDPTGTRTLAALVLRRLVQLFKLFYF